MGWPGKKNGGHATRVQRPMARTDELVVEEVGEEVLVYDQRNDLAHCLSGSAVRVWRVSDGTTTPEQMSATLELDMETVRDALEELWSCDLLEAWQPAGVTRREATVRLAKTGAVAAAAPLIYSIAAPTPALAASQATCNAITPACSGNCGTSGCKSAGCVCCNASGGPQKLCTADCGASNCSVAAFAAAGCGTVGGIASCS
jgi:hypothetical protein